MGAVNDFVFFRGDVFYYRGYSFRFPGVATVPDALSTMDSRLRGPSPPGAPCPLTGIVDQSFVFIGKKKGESKDRAGFLVGFFFGEPHGDTPIETRIDGDVNLALYGLPDPNDAADNCVG